MPVVTMPWMKRGQGDKHVAGHHGVQLLAHVALRVAPDAEQAQHDGVLFDVVQVDERREEVVPEVHEPEHRDGGHRRHHQRHDDLGEDAEGGAAVDLRGLVELLRYRLDELPEQEDPERASAEEPGHDQRLVGVDPAQPVEQQILRDDHDRRRDQHGHDQVGEPHVAAREAQPGEREPGDGSGNNRPEQRQRGNEDGVGHRPRSTPNAATSGTGTRSGPA